MVRLVDIAQELNLNVSVVSRALNPAPDKHAVIKPETRELIRSTAAKMGYRPNRQAAFLKKGGNAARRLLKIAELTECLQKIVRGGDF